MTSSLAPTQEFLTNVVNRRVTLPGLPAVNKKGTDDPGGPSISCNCFLSVPGPLITEPSMNGGSGTLPGKFQSLPLICLITVLSIPTYKSNLPFGQIFATCSGETLSSNLTG